MIFIYGENDPWTAAGVTWLKGKKNIHVFVEPGGSHRARIGTLPEEEKKQVMELINEWLKHKNGWSVWHEQTIRLLLTDHLFNLNRWSVFLFYNLCILNIVHCLY